MKHLHCTHLGVTWSHALVRVYIKPVSLCIVNMTVFSLWMHHFSMFQSDLNSIFVVGGERSVVRLLDTESRETVNKALLEDEDTKNKTEQSSIRKFIMRPYFLGRDLLSIEKFGLVQYVS